MTTSNPFNPFANIDMAKFDPAKMMAGMNVPGIDMQAMLDAQRKNIEALNAANQVAVEGMQALAKRQAEIMAEAMNEIGTVSRQLGDLQNPQDMAGKQAQMVQETFEKALGYMRELAEMVNKSNSEAFEVINKRFNESLEELRSMMPKNGN